MKTSTSHARHLRPAISKIVLALTAASVIGAMAVTPALAKDNDNRKGHQDQGLHKGERQGDRDRREHRPVYQRPDYAQPVYAPPPLYYDPQPSPGISLFLPLNIRF
jgi:hypothetical protein